MPNLTLLTPEELQERKKKPRQRQREERERQVQVYKNQLANAKPGWAGEVQLEDAEQKQRVRTLIKEASVQLGLTLTFRAVRDPRRLAFVVEAPSATEKKRPGRPARKQALPPPPATPAKGRGGRRRQP